MYRGPVEGVGRRQALAVVNACNGSSEISARLPVCARSAYCPAAEPQAQVGPYLAANPLGRWNTDRVNASERAARELRFL